MHTAHQTISTITSEQFINLCNELDKEDKHQQIIQILKEMSSVEAHSIIHDNNDKAFRAAAANGHTDVMKLLLDLTPDPELRNKMIHANNDRAFRDAVRYDRIEVMKLLLEITSNSERIKMVQANGYDAVKYAIYSKNIECFHIVMEYVLPAQRASAVISGNYHPITSAADSGNIEFFCAVIEYVPNDQRVAAITSYNYAVIRSAVKLGNIEFFRAVIGCVSIAQRAAVVSNNYEYYEAVSTAVKSGNIEFFCEVIELLPYDQRAMAIAFKKFGHKYEAVRVAAESENIELFRAVMEYVPLDQRVEAVAEDGYGKNSAIGRVAWKGNLEFFHAVVESVSEAQQVDAIAARDYSAVRYAVGSGNIKFFRTVIEYMQIDQRALAVVAKDYEAVRSAIKSGNIEFFYAVMEYVPTDQRVVAIAAKGYDAVRSVAKSGNAEFFRAVMEYVSIDKRVVAVVSDIGDRYEAVRVAANSGSVELFCAVVEYVPVGQRVAAVAIPYVRKPGYDCVLEPANYLYYHHGPVISLSTDMGCALGYAVKLKNIELFRAVIECMPVSERAAAIASYNFDAVKFAAKSRDIEFFRVVIEYIPQAQRVAAKAVLAEVDGADLLCTIIDNIPIIGVFGEADSTRIVAYVSEIKYDNIIFAHPEFLLEAYKISGKSSVNNLIDLGQDKEVAETIIDAVNTYGAKHVLEIIFGSNNVHSNRKPEQPNERTLEVIEKTQQTLEIDQDTVISSNLILSSFVAKEAIEILPTIKYFMKEILQIQYELPEFVDNNYFKLTAHFIACNIGAFAITGELDVTSASLPTAIYGGRILTHEYLAHQKQLNFKNTEDKSIDDSIEFIQKCGFDIATQTALGITTSLISGSSSIMCDVVISATVGGVQCYDLYNSVSSVSAQSVAIIPYIADAAVLYSITGNMDFDFNTQIGQIFAVKQVSVALSSVVITDYMTKLLLANIPETCSNYLSNIVGDICNYFNDDAIL